ncbi:MAG: type II secretion system protein N [Legionella sp.]
MTIDVKLLLSKPVIPVILNLILILLIISQLVLECQWLYRMSRLESSQGKSTVAIRTGNTKERRTLVNLDFFGEYLIETENEKKVVPSTLNLDVVGVMFADDEQSSQVIIRTANGQEKIFRAGDSLSNDAVIKRITQEGLLILHNGAIERVSLPKNELIFEPIAKSLVED